MTRENVSIKFDTSALQRACQLLRGARMGIKLISQPDKSFCCGQACIAMVAGVTLETAKKAVGKAGSTSTKVLRKGLEKLGVKVRKGRLIAIRGDLAKLPEVCILKIRSPLSVSGWHWVLKFKKKLYCPSNGVFMVAGYEDITGDTISSYLEILTDPDLLGDFDPKNFDPNENLTVFKGASMGPTEAVAHTISVVCPYCTCVTNFVVNAGHLEFSKATCYVCHRGIIGPARKALREARSLHKAPKGGHPLTAPKGSNVATAGPNAHESRTLTDIDRVAAQAPKGMESRTLNALISYRNYRR